MTEQDKEKLSEDRIEEIKREANEDASAYYAQGEGDGDTHAPENYDKPVDRVDPSIEELSFLKTVAFLGFGLATLAIVFILFFIRDLDERVVTTDKKIDSTASTVAKIDSQMEPFKKEVNEKVEKINDHVNKIQGKVNSYERMMAVMELKRALVAIQEVTGDSNQVVKSKTGMVISSIQSLLGELDAEKNGKAVVDIQSNLIVEEESKAESASTTDTKVDENKIGKKFEDKMVEVVVKEIDDDMNEGGKERVVEDGIPSIENMSQGSVGEIQLSEGSDELPTVEELLKEE